jgi:hypothetical protein
MRDEVYSSIGYGAGIVISLYLVGGPFFGSGYGFHWILGLTFIVSIALFSCWPNYSQYIQFSLNTISSFPVGIILPRESEDTKAQSIFMAPIFASILAAFWLPAIYILSLLLEYIGTAPLRYFSFILGPPEGYINSSGVVLDFLSLHLTGIYAVMAVFYIGIIAGTYLYILVAQFGYYDRKLFWPFSRKFISSFEWAKAASTREDLYAEMIFLVFSLLLVSNVVLAGYDIILDSINHYLSRFSTVSFS